jgi:YesN/AraC family two-component response regulator
VFRTLIVDDEPIARRVLHDELDEFGDVAIIGEAENGTVAVDLIQRLTPDLVFLDLQMPELGGIELIRRVSARKLPAIIVVSACEDCSRKALRVGAVGYLLKPVNPSSLRGMIDQLRQIPSIGSNATRPEVRPREVGFLVRSELCKCATP